MRSDTTSPAPAAWIRAARRALLGSACAALVALGAACGSHGAKPQGGDAPPNDTERAAALEKAEALPDRFEVVALADRLAVAAVSAGKPEATRLATLAGGLRERLFRSTHGEGDGREAVALFERASEGGPELAACQAGVRRAILLGELSRDPAVTLREAFATATRFDRPECSARVDELLALLAPWRAKAGVPARVVAASAASGSVAPLPGPSAGAPSGVADEAFASPAPPPASAEPVKVVSLSPYGDVEAARVVVNLSGPTSFQIGSAPPLKPGGGPRVYVDIARARLGPKKREQPIGGVVERVRMAPHGDGVRVVLDLSKVAFRRVFYLPEPFRIVIDVTTRAPGGALALASAGAKRPVSRVVLDPGHGGSDPGAIGVAALREKDVTLDIAHRAGPVLARELGISTLLTRDRDDYVSLEERTQRANAFGADLFVSIHCNASESSAARGVQTYVLDTTSDDIAGRVAARENASSTQAGAEVSKLLSSLKLADLGARSTRLAELLQRTAISSLAEKYPGTQDGGVKTAGFYVLVGAQMPAVLFETSFISNPSEEERLSQGDYRQRLADAIVNAIRAYREGK